MTNQFTVYGNGEGEWIVAERQKARSFAMVPMYFGYRFESRKDAVFQAADLNTAKRPLEVRMIETPDRFEEVADKTYGVAW